MCISTEAVDELHAVTTALKATQAERDTILRTFDEDAQDPAERMEVAVTRAECDRIFADRIAALEKRLKDELGWSRTIRVDSGALAAEIDRGTERLAGLAKTV